jgi:V/A-type H+-transporting ATPase subunit F
MKLFLISDKADTLMGMRLAGVEGVKCVTREETESAIRSAVADPELGILMITATLTELCRDLVTDRKLNFKRPLLVEVPDRDSPPGLASSLERYIGDAVGIRL